MAVSCTRPRWWRSSSSSSSHVVVAGIISRRLRLRLSRMTICLAFTTSFLVVVYISFLITNKPDDDHATSSLTSTPPALPINNKLKEADADAEVPVLLSAQNHINNRHHHIMDLHANTNSSSTNYTSPSAAHPSHVSSPTRFFHSDDVYHDKHIFLENYEEMKRRLKVYIYPHKREEPFASALLPVEDQEPGGNYASESYFKNLLFKSHFITNDSSKADLFFLPFSIARLRHDPRVGVGGLQNFIKDYMMKIMQDYPYWNHTAGADHFYVACHSIGRMAMEKVDHVKANAIQVVCSSSYFLPNYFAHKDVCLPQIWPRHHEPPNLSSSQRTKLAFFAGAVNSPVRKALVQAWRNDSSIFAHSGRLKTPYSEQLLRSKYCLHVKGFEVNTARIGDALYYGCVPVILADHYDLPFMDILNWKSFSVVITSSDIPNLKQILENIRPREYSALQANVLKVRKHFQWNKYPLDFDAFYMVMYELWLRRSSIRVLS